jgi:hypothetical protein
MSGPLNIEYPDAWYHVIVMKWLRRADLISERMRIISTLLSLWGDNLEETGREFNVTRFSPVSGVVERMRGKISGDRQLRNCVKEIKIVLQMSQT